MAEDDPNTKLSVTEADVDKFIKEKKIDLEIHPGTKLGDKGLTIWGVTPEEARYNITLALSQEKAAKRKFEKGYSGGWWSDIKTYAQEVVHTPLDLGKGGFDNARTRSIIITGKFIKDIPTVIELTQDQKDDDELNRATLQGNIDTAKQYQWRQIAGFATASGEAPTFNELQRIDPGLYYTDPDTSQNKFDGNRWKPGGNVRFRTPGVGAGLYRGAALTDERNFLSRGQYATDATAADTRLEMMKLNSSGQLLAVLAELKRVGGFYSENADISSQAKNKQGYLAVDEQAFNRFLDYSNSNLKTWEAMMPVLAGMGSHTASGGASFRGDSEADITAYLDEVSLALTGEKLTKAKLKRAIANVQAEAKASFRSGTTGASSSVLAEQQVLKAVPAQAASYGLGNAIQLAFEALGS